MCITLTYSLAEYSLEVQLKTFKHCIADMAVLDHMKYLVFVLKIKIMYIFLEKKLLEIFFKVVLFYNISYNFNKFSLLIVFLYTEFF